MANPHQYQPSRNSAAMHGLIHHSAWCSETVAVAVVWLLGRDDCRIIRQSGRHISAEFSYHCIDNTPYGVYGAIDHIRILCPVCTPEYVPSTHRTEHGDKYEVRSMYACMPGAEQATMAMISGTTGHRGP